MAMHRQDIVPDAKRGNMMARLDLPTSSLHDPHRTGRAKHREPAHRADTTFQELMFYVSREIGGKFDRAIVSAMSHTFAPRPFCDSCGGPYEGWLEQYGGHWDTCPNREN